MTRLIAASDLHGSAHWCRLLLQAFSAEQPERLILLGDLLYHGPRNSLPDDYNPKEVINLLNTVSDRLLCVRGNCDARVDQAVLHFPILADYAVIRAAGRLIYATHGDVYRQDNPPPLCPGDILLHGHTHIPCWQSFGSNNLCLNPGSVSLPKGGSPHSYLLISDSVLQWKNLENGKTFHELVL